MLKINVYTVPQEVPSGQLAGSTTVVIDVLRATTSMVWALGNQASAILPVADVDAARALAGDRRKLCGERQCVKLEGFDLGNSPRAFSAAAVRGHELVMTTTNGTRALQFCDQATEVLVAAFANLSAVAQQLQQRPPETLCLLCAGTDGRSTEEDTLLAGAIVDLVRRVNPDGVVLNPDGEAALDQWQGIQNSDAPNALVSALAASRGAVRLIALGYQADIHAAAEIDKFNVVPRLDRSTGKIVPGS